MFNAFSKLIALALSGLATFTLTPTVDFSKYVTPPSQLMLKSWLRTADTLNKAAEKFLRKA